MLVKQLYNSILLPTNNIITIHSIINSIQHKNMSTSTNGQTNTTRVHNFNAGLLSNKILTSDTFIE